MKYGIYVTAIVLWLCAKPTMAAEAPWIEFYPENPTAYSYITYQVDLNGGCLDLDAGNLIDYEHKVIKIAASASVEFATCPGPFFLDLGYLRQGRYQVEAYSYQSEETALFVPENLVLTRELVVAEPTRIAVHESPKNASIQSGVGVIRGWVCDAAAIVVTIDGKPYVTGYGVSRGDTRTKCGDSDNGYSMLVNWNLFGEGEHTLRVSYATRSGQPLETIVDDIKFTVVALDNPYYKGLERSIQVPDFPVTGQSVTLDWSTVDQNFKISDHQ